MAKIGLRPHESDLIDSFYGKLKINRIRENSDFDWLRDLEIPGSNPGYARKSFYHLSTVYGHD
jgi:hypothetical protein